MYCSLIFYLTHLILNDITIFGLFCLVLILKIIYPNIKDDTKGVKKWILNYFVVIT